MRKSTLRTTRLFGKPGRESASTWPFTIRKDPISHVITERRLKYIWVATTKLKRPHGTLAKNCLDNGVHLSLAKRITTGRLKKEEKIYEAIGRIKERYPRVARYYKIEYDSLMKELFYQENAERKSVAESLDRSYMLRTNRTRMSDDEIWRTYSLLTRCENAFRNMKSPLCERPIFHQLKERVQTHIFLCILAYHLLVAIEKTLSNEGIHTSGLIVKDTLKTHQVGTVILPTTGGEILKIRKGVNAEPEHLEIYKSLKIPSKVMKPVKTWHSSNIVTERTRKPP